MLVRENGKRKIVDEELDTCRCLPENLERIVSNRDTLIQLPRHCIKKWGVSRRLGVGLAVRVTAPLRLTEAVSERGKEQLASLSKAANAVGTGSSHDQRIFRDGWGGTRGKETTLSSWERWGSFRDTTLA